MTYSYLLFLITKNHRRHKQIRRTTRIRTKPNIQRQTSLNPQKTISKKKQEKITRHLNAIDQRELPSSLSIHGPPGTGKSFTTKKICKESRENK